MKGKSHSFYLSTIIFKLSYFIFFRESAGLSLTYCLSDVIWSGVVLCSTDIATVTYCLLMITGTRNEDGADCHRQTDEADNDSCDAQPRIKSRDYYIVLSR